MAHRWVCPECGTGRLAPSRMARDDVRRWCLDCSRKSPKLVAMTCPVLEKQRAEKRRDAARKQRERRRERIATAYLLDDGYDHRVIARKVARLGTWKNEGPEVEAAVRPRAEAWAQQPVLPDKKKWPWRVYALMLVDRAAHVADTELLRRKVGMASSTRVSLFRHAACEYFGLEWLDVVERKQIAERLSGRSFSDWDAILDAATAKADGEGA